MNAAMEKANKIDRSKYTEESLKALDDAVAAVEKGLKESEQSKVDAMAAAIEKALGDLVEKPVVKPEKRRRLYSSERSNRKSRKD